MLHEECTHIMDKKKNDASDQSTDQICYYKDIQNKLNKWTYMVDNNK